MGAAERCQHILDRLYQRRQDTVANLAHEFGVCVRTIHYDIDALSLEHPIETVRGRHGGGVSIMDGCRLDKQYLSKSEQATLEGQCSNLKGQQLADVQSIFRKFAVPQFSPYKQIF